MSGPDTATPPWVEEDLEGDRNAGGDPDGCVADNGVLHVDAWQTLAPSRNDLLIDHVRRLLPHLQVNLADHLEDELAHRLLGVPAVVLDRPLERAHADS